VVLTSRASTAGQGKDGYNGYRTAQAHQFGAVVDIPQMVVAGDMHRSTCVQRPQNTDVALFVDASIVGAG
jgi:hypothetical protein